MAVIPKPFGATAQTTKPNFPEQFAAFAEQMKAKFKAEAQARALARAKVPVPTPTPFDIEAARAELSRLERSHSDSYVYADDRETYQKGLGREQTIAALRADIARAEQAQQRAA